jgi:hypothetical protein
MGLPAMTNALGNLLASTGSDRSLKTNDMLHKSIANTKAFKKKKN